MRDGMVGSSAASSSGWGGLRVALGASKKHVVAIFQDGGFQTGSSVPMVFF